MNTRRNPFDVEDAEDPAQPLTDEVLAEIEAAAKSATPSPWYVRFLDDNVFMNLTAISTVPDTEQHEVWPDFDHSEIIAATLVQAPRYVDVADGKWDENAAYIVQACNNAPAMAAKIRRLREALKQSEEHTELAAFTAGWHESAEGWNGECHLDPHLGEELEARFKAWKAKR